MERNMLKKLLVIILIIMLTATDFFWLGSGIASYAASLDNSTNNDNIEFSSYFKNDKGEKVESISPSIKAQDLKLYAQITVKNEGYFNGAIEILNSNFNVKNNILSDSILSIEGNKINLNQINAGSTVEIELDIEPIISEKMTSDMLAKESTVKLTGTYMETTYEGLNIEGEKTVKLDLKVDETAQAELTTEIVTNKVFSINGENKRVVQLLVKSRLSENQFPIKQTVLKINVPQLGNEAPEEVKVLSLGTNATDGKDEPEIENWKNENGVVEITLQNEGNEISWKKDCYDELIVTFIYSEQADASIVEIETNSEISVHNSESKFMAKHLVGIENKELNNIITAKTEATSTDISKGQLYANSKNTEKKEIAFSSKTTIEIRSIDIADAITIQEVKDVYATNDSELVANTRFVSTEINKQNMLDILGENGNIQIKYGDSTYNITKDTEANESGNIIVNYDVNVSELEITTSKPVKAGKLEIKHNKAIMGDSNTTDQIKTIKSLKLRNTIKATLEEQIIVENFTETPMELKETTTKAELILNKDSLSTMTENKEIILGVKLITNDVKYDLYKNPTIKIQLPQSIEEISINSFDKLYGDEFEIERAVYNKAQKTIEISLIGEQLNYAESDATQLYLQMNFNATLSKTEPSKTDKITMEYTNQNASQYDSGNNNVGIVEKNINIVSLTGLVTMNNVEQYGIEGISGIGNEEQTILVNKEDAGKTIDFDLTLVNNTGEDISNVIILGKLPTEGNKIDEQNNNTLETALKGIIANAEIYYSENENATADLTQSTNGWTSDLATLTNPKVYLIKINNMPQQSVFDATYTIQLPNQIETNEISYSDYVVMYDTATTAGNTEESTTIGIETPTEIKLSTNLTAKVGNDTLENGDTVNGGETIKYSVNVTNNGTQDLTNVTVNSKIPVGTVYVENGSENAGITEINKVIDSLKVGETKTVEYELKVKEDIADKTEISNKVTVTCKETSIESNELKFVAENADIEISIEKYGKGDEITFVENMTVEYKITVENKTTQPIKNLQLRIFNDNKLKTKYIANSDMFLTEVPEVLTIEEIPAEGNVYYIIGEQILENVTEFDLSASVETSDGNTYRSNTITQKVETANATISMNSIYEGENVKEGEVIQYEILVQNTGSITTTFTVKVDMPEDLTIEEVYLNGTLRYQSTDISDSDTYFENIKINELLRLVSNQKATLKINARANNLPDGVEVKPVIATAKVIAHNEEKATSAVTVNIVQSGNNSGIIYDGNVINGIAWLDQNVNGERETNETVLTNIPVKLYDVSKNDYARNENGDIIQTVTSSNGTYYLSKIEEGQYIVIFEYDTSKYEPTIYQKADVDPAIRSSVIEKEISINGENKVCAVTDTINVTGNVSNINLGLKELNTFDFELDKYISRIVVQNSKGTKAYDYDNSTFEKVEISSKLLNSTMVVLEYKIVVKNTGDIPGIVRNIVDYFPETTSFSSELNQDWYMSDNYLYNKSLANEIINPGESREVKLILTKQMTENNTGVINNRAEIYESYNDNATADRDSTPNNRVNEEDDMGSVDVMIGISTGVKDVISIILIIVNTILIIIAIRFIIVANGRKMRKGGR